MKRNMGSPAYDVPGLNLLGARARAGACKVYSRMWLVVMLLGVLVAGCNGTNEKLGGGGTTGPSVSSTVPAAGATGVAIDTTITATFNTAMDPLTIESPAENFTVSTGGSSIAGGVALSADGLTATFTPSASLTADKLYTATITTGVKDVNGNALAANKVWSFTTGTGTTPTVLSTVPIDGATLVSPTADITATFSTEMDPATITTTTFTVTGQTAATGTVTLSADGLTATFAPTGLAVSTIYVARITAGAKDVNGNAVNPEVWSFTTAP